MSFGFRRTLLAQRRARRDDFRAMIVCKYWIARSAPPSSGLSASLQKYVDQQTTAVDRANLTDVPEPDQIPESSQCSERRDDRESLCEHCTLNLAFETFTNDPSFKSDLDDFPAEKDRECDRSRVARKDAEIQTSSRTSSWRWRRRTRERSRTISEDTLRRSYDDEPGPRSSYENEIFADFRADLRRLDGRGHVEKSRLTVRVLENKRAEYIDKFNAVNRQIEEITATLRETCCNDRNPRGNPDEYEYLAADNATKVKAKRKFDENELAVLPKESTPREEDSGTVGRSISELERRKNAREISRVDCIDDETSVILRDTLAAVPMTRYRDSDLFLHDFAGAFATNETVHLASKTARSKRRAKCRQVARQISFDLDSTKDQDERQEFSIDDESFSEIYVKDDFAVSNGGEEYRRRRAPIDDLGVLQGLRWKKVAEEKMGERAMLVDIKRRIDRDFDNLSVEKCDNDMEDFLAIPQKSNSLENKCRFYDTTKRTTTPRCIIEESRSTPLLMYGQPSDASDVRICDSISVGTVSDYSNRNSTLSKYFSCTQLSSLISLTENEDEFAYALNDQDTIARDLSCANLHSDSNYYDLDLGSSVDYLNPDSNPNNSTYANRDSSFNRSSFNAGYAIRYYDSSAPYKSPDKYLIEPIKQRNDMFERSEDGDPENKVYRCEYLCRDNGKAKQSTRVELEKRYTTDSTFDSTSKSSRYIGSIDSGVFVNSSLIDFYPHESSVDPGKSGVKRKIPYTRSLNESSLDSSSDGSCTDDTLGRKVDDVVRNLTKNLILCERRARMRLEEMQKSFRAREAPYVRIRDPVVFAKFLWHLKDVADPSKQST